MSVSVDSNSWETIDGWWDSFVEDRSIAKGDDATANLDKKLWDGLWQEVDQWWESYVQIHSIATVEESTALLDERWRDGLWNEMEPWWETYSERQRLQASELAELLDELDESWKRSESRFDSDPLSVDWTAHTHTRGPLRPNQEENWSQWLAHLLRSNGEFVGELFGDNFEGPPDSVRREVYLPSSDPERPDRYPDILLFSGQDGVSIEVKIGDEHFGKTPHTAALVERHHHKDWHHVLLVPEYKRDTLEEVFEDELEGDSERLRIDGEQSGPLEAVFWRDVTAAIREMLRKGESTDHWESSAYVFCTLVEQKVLGFNTEEKVADLAEASDVIKMSDSLSVSGGDVGKQLNYLGEMGFEYDNE